VRMEDGFIRSRGLGSDFFGALSVALDDQGVYYDATRPSRLETLIGTADLSGAALERAGRLRRRIVETGLSKYNLKGEAPAGWPTDRERLLVVGQVENDKSIALGCTDIRTNSGLVEAARRDFPDAFLIYRNHPDVMAGNRPGRLDAGAMQAVDAVADDLDIIDCLNTCDRLATLTSLSGFEALMRGKAVTTYGRPFYAGWGLTDDRTGPFERRVRPASLDAVVHGALITYPIYVMPNGWPCEAEDLIEALVAARDTPLPPAPRGRINRWWRGMMASLDRTPPPAY
ncbi:MAG: capsular biosynthesis protein, partial [Alphaproteobacteria bacterium]